MSSDHSSIIVTLINKLTDLVSFKHSLEEKMNLSIPLFKKSQLDAKVEMFVNNTPVLKNRVSENNYPK